MGNKQCGGLAADREPAQPDDRVQPQLTRAVAEFNDRSHQIHQLSVEQKLQETQFLQAILERLVSQHQAAALARVFIMLLDGATLTAQINGPEAAATEAWSAAERLLAVAGATR